MKLNVLILSTLSVLALVAVGCKGGGEDTSSPAPTGIPKPKAAESNGPAASAATFASAQAIFAKNCVGCHGEKGKGRIDLRSAESIMKGGEDGPIVVAGKSADSLIIKALKGQGAKQMPPKGALPQADIDTVAAWIDAGAPSS